MKNSDQHTLMAITLAQVIAPLLGGHPAYVQSAALADLVAIWIAGHRVPDNPDETDKFRRELLDDFIKLVWQLVPMNEEHALEFLDREGRKH